MLYFLVSVKVLIPLLYISEAVYEGASATVIKEQHYSGSFVCTFDVFYYPFDMQQCTVLMQMSSLSKNLVSLTKSRARVEFIQDSELSTYVINDFFVEEVANASLIKVSVYI